MRRCCSRYALWDVVTLPVTAMARTALVVPRAALAVSAVVQAARAVARAGVAVEGADLRQIPPTRLSPKCSDPREATT